MDIWWTDFVIFLTLNFFFKDNIKCHWLFWIYSFNRRFKWHFITDKVMNEWFAHITQKSRKCLKRNLFHFTLINDFYFSLCFPILVLKITVNFLNSYTIFHHRHWRRHKYFMHANWIERTPIIFETKCQFTRVFIKRFLDYKRFISSTNLSLLCYFLVAREVE